jgi:hypothetical protein
LFTRIVRAIANYFLHRMIKNSDVSEFSLDIKEIDGKYVVAIGSAVALATKGEVLRKDTGSRNITIVFLVALSATVALNSIGILLPDAIFGRTLVYLGTFPAILVNIIAARYIIRNIT